jgi:hypothetical protein
LCEGREGCDFGRRRSLAGRSIESRYPT